MSMDDFIRLRLALDAPRRRRPLVLAGSSFVGKVASTGADLGVGKFAIVHPVVVTGAETEGTTGTATVDTSVEVPVYMAGPDAPATDDLLDCHFADHRWVASKVTGLVTYPPAPEGVFCIGLCRPTTGPMTISLTWNSPISTVTNDTLTYQTEPDNPLGLLRWWSGWRPMPGSPSGNDCTEYMIEGCSLVIYFRGPVEGCYGGASSSPLRTAGAGPTDVRTCNPYSVSWSYSSPSFYTWPSGALTQ